MDLFSQLPEPKKVNTCEQIENVISNKEVTEIYKGEITVKMLSNSAIQKFRDQGKEVTQTEKGITIKY